MLGHLGQDVRYALRVLRKERAFTLVAMSILALGIGGAVSMFGVVEATLLRPLPYPNAPRVVALWEERQREELEMTEVSGPNFLDWRAQAVVLDAMAAFMVRNANLSGVGQPDRLQIATTSATLFDILGVQPGSGRVYAASEEDAGAPRVAVISDRLWRSRFAGEAAAGRTIRLDGEPHTIVGVMPAEFDFPAGTDVWVPLVLGFWGQPEMRASHNLSVIARMRPGATLSQAQAEMRTIAARLESQYPDANTGRTAVAVPLREELVGDTRIALIAAFAAVIAVLLIACANVANLLFTRAATRRAEIMVRVAMGAGSGRIVSQFMVESLVLAAGAGLLGIALAWAATRGITVLAPQVEALSAARDLTMSPVAVAFALVLTVATALVFGMAPALSAARPDISASLREGGRGLTEGHRVRSLRSALTVGQIALSLVLVIGAGLLLQTLRSLEDERLGYDVESRVALDLSLAGPAYSDDASRAIRYGQLLEVMEAVPGVQQVAMTPQLPLDADPMQDNSFDIEGRPAPRTPAEVPGAYQRPVTSGYFETMGIPLLRGRAFTRGDDARAPLVAVIDSAAMERYWPNENPIGRRIHYNWGVRRTLTIVGVVGSVKHGRLRLETAPTIYVPLAQFPWNDMTVVARTSLPPGVAADAIARAVHAVDPELPLANIRTLEGVAAAALWRPRFASVLLGGFAVVGLLLSGLGLYGIMSYDVTRRAREIALRMALGAGTGDVSRLVLRRSCALVAIGIASGIALSFAANRVIAGLLHGVGAVDPSVYATALLVTAAVAALASAIPARRAAAVAPGEVLRGD